MYYVQGMIIITYVDECLLFGSDIKDIQKVIKDLEENGYTILLMNTETKINSSRFLGVIIKPYKESKMLVLNRTGLINNILETVRISDCNTQGSPTKVTPFRTNHNRPHCK